MALLDRCSRRRRGWFEWEFVLDAMRETEQQLELVKSIRL